MKRILCILLALSTLTTQVLLAQSCPANPTYKNQSGTYDLSSAKSLVFDNAKTFTATIENNFSSTSTICVLNGSTLNLKFKNANSLQKGGTIYIDKTSKLSFSGNGVTNFPLTIINSGTVSQTAIVIYSDGAVIDNSGTYTIAAPLTMNSGTVTISNNGAFTISDPATFNNGVFNLNNTTAGTLTFGSSVTFSTSAIANLGVINFKENVVLQNESSINNNGYIYLQNGTSNSLILNSTIITNNGVLLVDGPLVLNAGSTLINTCTVKDNSSFTNNGTVNNTGSLLLEPKSAAGIFVNQGVFGNGTNGFVQGNIFTNNGSITGGGNFYFAGVTTSQGTFKGTNGNKINFYDASPATSNTVFDAQGKQPENTTKNKISPNTSTSFSSCADITTPVITIQPQTQTFCSNTITSATFNITATSNTTPSYQWRKNGNNIAGATGSSYTATNLTFTDTLNSYTVAITNNKGTTISNSASLHYIIIAQPSPVNQYLATGNPAIFTIQTSGATALRWQKDNSNIINATAVTCTIPAVNLTDAGSYKAIVTYNGGTCTSDAAVLKTSAILYSKSTGNLNQTSNWGVEKDGSGSTPVNFTREDHTFIVSNRTSAETGGNISMAGKFDVANANVTITPGTTLNAGRIIRSSGAGTIAGSSTSGLTIHGISDAAYAGASDLYFDQSSNVLQNLTIAGHTVTLRNELNLTAGNQPGSLQVNSGSFVTSDALTLKSDAAGTAGIGKSEGIITGKVTIEKYMPARRAWRLMGAPISSVDAPSIHAAWQEGAANSTANPNMGYGTHITGGTEANGFDRSPTNNPSLKYYDAASNSWLGLANTSNTPVTQYPAYIFFVRGNRSYDIMATTNVTTPLPTIIRVKGNVYQGTQAAKIIPAHGLTLAFNPYAGPASFAKITEASTNVKRRLYVWDPMLAGTYGVGGWILLDGTGGTYKATPPSPSSLSTILQAGQGFFIETEDNTTAGSLVFNESAKDITASATTNKETPVSATDALLEVDLKVFNADATTGIADGVLYRFREDYNDSVDVYDARKIFNFNENLGIAEGKDVLTINRRTMPAAGDSLRLSLTGTRTTSYQIEMVPSGLQSKIFFLYDKYLNTLTPISNTDTSHFTISINTSIAASKAADRFIIVVQNGAILPVTFTTVKAYQKEKAVQVDWNVENETNIINYEVEKSANGTSFSKVATVTATGANSYGYTDVSPVNGTNFYRIKSVDISGEIHYTDIVNVVIEVSNNAPVSIYPNPVTGNAFTVTFTGMTAGVYTLSVINQKGNIVFTKQIRHAGGTASQKVQLTRSLPAGIYYLKTTSENGNSNLLKIVVN